MVRAGGTRRTWAHLKNAKEHLVLAFVDQLEYEHDIDLASQLLDDIFRGSDQKIRLRVAEIAGRLLRDEILSALSRAKLEHAATC